MPNIQTKSVRGLMTDWGLTFSAKLKRKYPLHIKTIHFEMIEGKGGGALGRCEPGDRV